MEAVGLVLWVVGVLLLIDVFAYGALMERYRRKHGTYEGWATARERVMGKIPCGALMLCIVLHARREY